jgi:hypothetical protein
MEFEKKPMQVLVLGMLDYLQRDGVSQAALDETNWGFSPRTGDLLVKVGKNKLRRGRKIAAAATKNQRPDAYTFATHGGLTHPFQPYGSLSVFHPAMNLEWVLNEASNITEHTWRLTAADNDIRRQMVPYLQYDDGYEECVNERSPPEVVEFKRVKLEHLIRSANDPRRWLMAPPPDWKTMGNPNDLSIISPRLRSTCRLIMVKHDDLNGNALPFMREALELQELLNLHFTHIDLDIRSLQCIRRFIELAKQKYKTTLKIEKEKMEGLEQGSQEWSIAYVKYSELQVSA